MQEQGGEAGHPGPSLATCAPSGVQLARAAPLAAIQGLKRVRLQGLL